MDKKARAKCLGTKYVLAQRATSAKLRTQIPKTAKMRTQKRITQAAVQKNRKESNWESCQNVVLESQKRGRPSQSRKVFQIVVSVTEK